MKRGASPLSSVSYNLRLSIYRCSPEVFSWDGTSPSLQERRNKVGLGQKVFSRNVRGVLGGFSSVFTLNG